MSESNPRTDGPPDLTPSRRELRIASMAGGVVLLVAAVVIVASIALRLTGGPTNGAEPAPESYATANCETIISSGDVEASVALPTALTVKGVSYALEPIVPEAEVWEYPADRSDVAVWICGTVVNYVVGLPPTTESEGFVASLAPGDEIGLGFANGGGLLFRFSQHREVPAGDQGVQAQRRPQLTLVLPAGETWQVASADYVAQDGPIAAPVPGASIQVGGTIQVGDAVVMVTGAYAQRENDLPGGTMHYLVDFSVRNVGEAALSTSSFSMQLQDSLGNTYLVSRSASEAGGFGPLSGEIAPGASVDATAGYLVADPLPAGSLTWRFSPRPGSPEEASIGIPHDGDEASLADASAEVTVDDAFLGSDGGVLVIMGRVANTGERPLTVEAGHIALSSDPGSSELISTAPPLVWVVEPGQTQDFELQYQRPDAPTVVLDLLGHSFEIGGLQQP